MDALHPIFQRYPELKEFTRLLRHEIQQSKRPANEIVLTDQDLMQILKISKRKVDDLKAKREIPFSQPIPRSRSYFLLSDVLEWINKGRVNSISNESKI